MPEMPDAGFDLLVIGGGPAGLVAARTAARLGARTVLCERLPRAGNLGHPCGAAIAPLPGFVSGRQEAQGLCFPELDLFIPADMIVGTPTRQRYISPAGHALVADFPARPDFPLAVIDKPALLRRLARQASAAGAELRFGCPVTGLLEEGSAITGVQTRDGPLRARLVLAAEGVSRRFSEAAGLYGTQPRDAGYAFVVSQVLDAPAADDVGQITTLGQRYTSLPRAFGTLVIPRPGRAEVYWAVFADEPNVHADEPLWHYLEEYKQRDPRVSHLLAGARVVQRAGCRMTLRPVPAHVVRDGFIAVGDTVGPGGHVGIVPCMFLGQAAARVAAQAIQGGDLSARSLAPYDRLFHGRFLRGLETESRIMTGLAHMSDEEIDRACLAMSRVNLAPFFFGEMGPLLRETARWLVTSFPLILRDWRLIRRMMGGEAVAQDPKGLRDL
jgi:digeranylgeranylglycerophospholipid reductase